MSSAPPLLLSGVLLLLPACAERSMGGSITEPMTHEPTTNGTLVGWRLGDYFELWEVEDDSASGTLFVYVIDVSACESRGGDVKIYRGGSPETIRIPQDGLQLRLDGPVQVAPLFNEDVWISIPSRLLNEDDALPIFDRPHLSWLLLLLDDSGLTSRRDRRGSVVERTWRCFGRGLRPTFPIDVATALPESHPSQRN